MAIAINDDAKSCQTSRSLARVTAWPVKPLKTSEGVFPVGVKLVAKMEDYIFIGVTLGG
jgi:hypothetical protein